MAHTVRDKKKLLNRVRRLRGQIDAIERALEAEQSCSDVLRLITSCRGAMNGLMVVVLEGHVRMHVLDPDGQPAPEQTAAAEELLDVVRAYLR